MSIWEWLLNPAGLTAHGFCLSWAPGLVVLHAGSDAVIGLAYFSIPIAMAWFVRERQDFKYWGIAYLFAAFILACGATHLLSIVTLWVPAYGVEGLVKALTAVLSITTAIVLWPLLPQLLALPSPDALIALNADLERRVAERTSALEAEIAARRDAEERFREVIEASPTAMMMIDSEGTIELVNRKSERTFGYSREEMLGRSVDILLPDRMRDHHGRHRAAFFAAPTPRAMGTGPDLFARRKDGSELQVEIGLNPLMTPQGRKVISSISDVTARKEIEKALADSEQQMRLMFDSIDGHAIFMLDVEGRIISWNSGAERLKGYKKEEVVGLHHRLFYTPEDVLDGKPERELIDAARDGRVEDEGPRQRKDGSRFMASVIINAVKDVSGDLRGFVKVTRDVTERNRIENELIETSSRLRDVLASASEISIIATDPKLLITVFNRGAENLLGYAGEEMIGRATLAAFHDGDEMRRRGAELSRRLGYPVEGGAVLTESSTLQRPREWTYVRKDGRRVRVSLVVTAMKRASGDLVGYLGIAHDVTREKEVEEKLREATLQAEQANQAKSAFLASMSHEIRTPMNGVIGFADLLLDSDLTEQQRNQTKRLLDAAKSLLSLINDILDLSKIEAGKLEIEHIPMNPAMVINGAVSIVRTQLTAKGLDLRVEIARDVPDWIEADPTRVRQILLNLLSNALKFTDHGRITVRCSRAIVEREQFLRFEVEDTGIGIAADRQHLLFRDFYQVDRSTRRRYGGTGLGLSICKRLARAMGGDVGVRSVPGEGSVIWFTIALRPCLAPDLSEGADPTDFVAKPARVLVADDLEMNRDIVETILRRAGHSIQAAENGRQAVTAVEESHFDVVLMDMEMPVMDGVEATRAIRHLDGRIRHIPIVALTANAFLDDRERCRDAGMNDFLAKPINRDALLAMVAKWSGGIPEETTDARPSPPLVLDPAALDALESAVGVAAAAEFSRKFRKHVGEALAAMTFGIEPDLIAREAHKLVNLASNVGCAELVGCARELGAAAKRENGDVSAILSELPAIADRAVAALAARYAGVQQAGESSMTAPRAQRFGLTRAS